MLYLYDKNTIDFTNNGEPIRYSYDEHVFRSEGFYLTFKLLLDFNRDYKKIKKEMIISAETPDGRNQFRVYDIVKRKDHVEVVAVQLMYDLDNKMVNPFKVNKVSGTTAINRFISSFKSSLGAFTLSSSVAETHDFSTNDENDDTPSQNALEVLNRITNRWDSELLVNGYDIRMIKRLGTRTNALLYEKKNISNFEDESTVRNMATRIHATSRFIAEGDDEETVISVSVDSPLINEYAQVYEKSFVNNDARTTQELVNWVNLKYSTENIDKPKRNINVSTNIIDGTEINYGDELVLKYLVHDVDEVIRCVGYDYNPVAHTYYSITLGGWKDSFATTLTGGIVDVTQRQVNQIKKNVTHILMNADGYHRNAYGSESVPNPINGDVWYYFEWERPNEIEMRIFEDGFWVPVPFGTKAEVEAAISEAESAKQAAANAYNDAVAEAERLVAAQMETFDAEMTLRKGEIQDVKTQADLAVGKANANAEAIFGKLDLATYEANKTAVETELGKKLATATYNAQKQTQDALIAGKVALTTYNAKMTSLDTAINGTSLRVDELEDGFALTATKTEVDSLKTRMNTAELSINATSNQLALKASQTDLNAATGRLTTAEGRITANATAIELRATKTDVDSLTGRVTTAEGTITAQAGQIALRATTDTVNALTGRVSAAEASLVVQSGKIDLTATKTELTTAVDGIEVGGRNYWAIAKEPWYSYLEHQGGGLFTNTTTLPAFAIFRMDKLGVPVGETYTVSFEINVSDDTIQFSYDTFYVNGASPSVKHNKPTLVKDKWVKVYATFNYTVENTGIAHIYFKGISAINTFQIRNFQLEKGNKATDWTPAPEDVDAAISTVQSNLTVEAGKITALTTRVSGAESNITSVTQTVGGINTTISTLRTDVDGKATIVSLNQVKSTADGNKTTITNHAGRLTTVETNVSGLQTTVADKADKSQITQLATSISTKVESTTYNSKMTQLDNAINLRVVQGDVTAAILADKRIKDTRATNQLPSWYYTNYPSQRVEEFKGRTVIGAPGSATYVKLVTDVPWGDTSGGVVVQTAYASDGVYNRSGNSAGTAWGAWVKQTDSANVLAQVNLSTEGVLIQGNRIQLDGDVTMTAAYVTKLNTQTLTAITANITSIRSQVLVTDSVTSTHIKAENALVDTIFGTTALITRLTSKTAFVDNIKAIDISADRITAGTLNAANVNITNLNVSKIVGLNSEFIRSNWNANGTDVSITGNGLESASTNGSFSRVIAGEVRSYSADSNTAAIMGSGRNQYYINGTSRLILGRTLHGTDYSGDASLQVGYGSDFILGRYDRISSASGVKLVPYIKFEYGSQGNEATGRMSFHKDTDVVAAAFNFRSTTQAIGRLARVGTSQNIGLHADSELSLGVNGGNVYASPIIINRTIIKLSTNLDMQGRAMVNHSDSRLKTNITTTVERGLDNIRTWGFVDFNWKDANRPKGRQFGLIAQKTSGISFEGDDGIWQINSSKQIMFNSLGIKELDEAVTRIETFTTQHELEIQLLKDRIAQLEEKIA